MLKHTPRVVQLLMVLTAFLSMPFAVPAQTALTSASITVTYPAGGEKLYIGDSHTIKWTSTGVTGTIAIQLIKDGIVYAGSKGLENTGEFGWLLGGSSVAGDGFLIKVSSDTDSSISGSSGQFAIFQKATIGSVYWISDTRFTGKPKIAAVPAAGGKSVACKIVDWNAATKAATIVWTGKTAGDYTITTACGKETPVSQFGLTAIAPVIDFKYGVYIEDGMCAIYLYGRTSSPFYMKGGTEKVIMKNYFPKVWWEYTSGGKTKKLPCKVTDTGYTSEGDEWIRAQITKDNYVKHKPTTITISNALGSVSMQVPLWGSPPATQDTFIIAE